MLELHKEGDYKTHLSRAVWGHPLETDGVEALVTVLTDEEKPRATFSLYLYFVLKGSFWVVKFEKIWVPFHQRKTSLD